jgi:hypothetical protein
MSTSEVKKEQVEKGEAISPTPITNTHRTTTTTAPTGSSGSARTAGTTATAAAAVSSNRVSFRQELEHSNERLVSDDEPTTNRVSFRQELENASASSKLPVPSKSTRSAKVGKADPKRDAMIVVGVFIVLYFMANSLSDIGTIYDDSINDGERILLQPKKSQLEIVRESLEHLVESHSKPHFYNPLRQKDNCPLLLNPSSIPDSGWGVFAGQKYTPGQEIVSVLVDHGQGWTITILFPSHIGLLCVLLLSR